MTENVRHSCLRGPAYMRVRGGAALRDLAPFILGGRTLFCGDAIVHYRSIALMAPTRRPAGTNCLPIAMFDKLAAGHHAPAMR